MIHQPSSLLVWDIETIPDIDGFARANDLEGASQEVVRAAIGGEFPKLIYHSVICIAALLAERDDDGWHVKGVAAPHVGDRSECELISHFVELIGERDPQLVTFNGNSFDLPVLRYRAMVHGISAPGLSSRPYFHRFTDDAVDLCDVMSSFSPRAKVTLNEMSRIMGLPGKPEGIDGSQVETFFRSGRIQEIADYSLSDVINTYRIWLRHELFRGRLTRGQFNSSEQDVVDNLDPIDPSPSLRSGEPSASLFDGI